jgi:hypothetical protein
MTHLAVSHSLQNTGLLHIEGQRRIIPLHGFLMLNVLSFGESKNFLLHGLHSHAVEASIPRQSCKISPRQRHRKRTTHQNSAKLVPVIPWFPGRCHWRRPIDAEH